MKVIGNDGSVRAATGEDLREVFHRRRQRDMEVLREEQEAWDEGLALEEKQEREKSMLGRFEVWKEEVIDDGFGHRIKRLVRRFRPPQNF